MNTYLACSKRFIGYKTERNVSLYIIDTHHVVTTIPHSPIIRRVIGANYKQPHVMQSEVTFSSRHPTLIVRTHVLSIT